MQCIEQLMKYFVPNVSESTVKLFRSMVELKQFPKGKIVLKQGQIPTKFYVLREGIVRSYLKTQDQKEHIRTLYTPVSTFGALSSLIKKDKSNATYDCLTDCVVYEGDYQDFMRITRFNSDLAQFYVKSLENIFIRTEKRVDELTILNATERYLRLKKDIPQIDNIIPQYHIASYLNITPVQLSRIRKKMYSCM